MTRLILFVCLFIMLFVSCREKPASEQTQRGNTDSTLFKQLADKRVTLPNGWSLTPAGMSVPLGQLPLNIAVSPSKKLLAVANNGQGKQTISLHEVATGKKVAETEIRRSWLGIRFSPDEKQLYVSAGNDNQVNIYQVSNKQLSLTDSIVFAKPWGGPYPFGQTAPASERVSVAGIELSPDGKTLYTVTKEDSALYVCDVATRKTTKRVKLPYEAYTCALSPASGELFISLWGGERIAIYDSNSGKLTSEIPVESHPNDLTFTQNGNYLFVANANSNSVSVIDAKAKKVIETIATALYPDAPTGSTANAVALSEDEKTLYIANADNNCLAVFDVATPGKSRSKGFIPTGWYPTAVEVIGNRVFVANGKGMSSLPNPKGPSPKARRTADTQYIGGLFEGTLSLIDVPSETQLSAYSELVYANTPYSKEREGQAEGEAGNPVPRKSGEKSPIKYVFYIIKENRTYDQVFGDMPEGNGDSSLCLFPQRVSPNHHALAREFVLLDNFYVDAEVSADGHNWSTAAYATDYVEKTWPANYSGRGGTYDYEGSRRIAYPEKGFIWDYCKRAGVSYRSYGEFADYGETGLPVLEGHVDADYPGYDLTIKDIAREKIWERDFDSLVAKNALPQFTTLRFGNDHTSGARVGMPTPEAHVADNDLALGRFIEHLSKSKVWAQSAVFVLEDDAQNGPDHVDAHRSPALIISPYTKRKAVIHEMYTTSGMLRTMELILGLPPMSQYDAAATPMWKCFQQEPNLTPYTALKNNVNLDERNVAVNESSRRSAEFNLAVEDAAPDNEFSEVIWKTVRGEHSQMPAPRRAAFIRLIDNEEEEEDDED